MLEFLKNWTLSIVTLALFIVMLEMLIPSGKTKKVVNLVSGFIMVIAIINPFIGLFGADIDLVDFQISKSNFLDLKDIEYKSKLFEETQIKQIIEVYRKKIIGQIESAAKEIPELYSVEADVIINEDFGSEEFGYVKRIYLNIAPERRESKERKIDIEKIQVVPEGWEQGDDDIGIDPQLREKIVTKIAGLLNVERRIIIISLMEE